MENSSAMRAARCVWYIGNSLELRFKKFAGVILLKMQCSFHAQFQRTRVKWRDIEGDQFLALYTSEEEEERRNRKYEEFI